MEKKLFSVYDKKAAVFMDPFSFGRTEEAVRAFAETANDARHQFHRWAEDYALYEVGSFNYSVGHVEGRDSLPLHVCEALAVVNAPVRAEQTELEDAIAERVRDADFEAETPAGAAE